MFNMNFDKTEDATLVISVKNSAFFSLHSRELATVSRGLTEVSLAWKLWRTTSSMTNRYYLMKHLLSRDISFLSRILAVFNYVANNIASPNAAVSES